MPPSASHLWVKGGAPCLACTVSPCSRLSRQVPRNHSPSRKADGKVCFCSSWVLAHKRDSRRRHASDSDEERQYVASESYEYESLAVEIGTSTKLTTVSEEKRKHNDSHQKDEEPTAVPNTGKFFMHDNRGRRRRYATRHRGACFTFLPPLLPTSKHTAPRTDGTPLGTRPLCSLRQAQISSSAE